MHFADGSELQVDFIVFSTGIRPRDKLATQCGLAVAQRGGIMVNDSCQTSDPDIYAIGECASWNNRVYGLVAPAIKWRWPSTISSAVKIASPAPTSAPS